MLSDLDKGAETGDGCGSGSHTAATIVGKSTMALQIDREITFTREVVVARSYRKSLGDEA